MLFPLREITSISSPRLSTASRKAALQMSVETVALLAQLPRRSVVKFRSKLPWFRAIWPVWISISSFLASFGSWAWLAPWGGDGVALKDSKWVLEAGLFPWLVLFGRWDVVLLGCEASIFFGALWWMNSGFVQRTSVFISKTIHSLVKPMPESFLFSCWIHHYNGNKLQVFFQTWGVYSRTITRRANIHPKIVVSSMERKTQFKAEELLAAMTPLWPSVTPH
jgi:hypothetical protein